MEQILVKLQDLTAEFGLRVLAAIAILIIGRWIAGILRKGVGRLMNRGGAEPTLTKFVTNLTFAIAMTFVFIAVLDRVGVKTTSLVAILGAAGLAVGLALQGSLANFAAGVMLIIFRPFKVGDFVECAGVAGIVEEIQIFTTQVRTGDNKTIIIPNAKVTSDNIVNYSSKDTRRVDMVFGIGYGDDIGKAKKILEAILAHDTRVLKDPAPTIGVLELGESSVNLAVRPWVGTADYWGVFFDTHEAVKSRFDTEGISIPFPQRDVHLLQQSA